ncbi:GNAT family N-acetyltransferase [Bacillus solimangrovi]|uniref:GNAT family N-acetyltransferase n=1 Tax=Bacillus solimangrovi TaxID=1305675 RepID=A0A1E5LK20_9BACI|nr:GNAT family protein [Bacillus solimangrovi]OEH94443.1 GNAT family N-acetyltransferase [Bacillus solimangrovi]
MFETKRICLQKMTMKDIEKYHSWKNDIDVMTNTSPYLDTYTFEETEEFVTNVILNNSNSKSYIIIDTETNKSIGVTSLVNIDWKNRNAECIIDIGEKDYWGKGLGKEALSLILQYAFSELNLNRISLKVYSFNKRAINLYTSLGFTIEGEIRKDIFRNGKWHNTILMGILSEEYFTVMEY